jgi:hypothetical protein
MTKSWMHNFLRGFGSVLAIWPEPKPHKFGVGFLDHSIEDGLRRDAMKVAGDMNAALARARQEVPYVGRRSATPRVTGEVGAAEHRPFPSRQPA